MLRIAKKAVFLGLVIPWFAPPLAAKEQTPMADSPVIKGDAKAPVKVKKKARAAKTQTPARFAVGIEFGTNATFGNGVKAIFSPVPFFGLQGGVGYNTTGLKAGLGGSLNLPISRLGVFTSLAFVHSAGTEDKVTLPVKFIPEGSSSEEKMNGVRKVRVTPAKYYSPFAGISFRVAQAFGLTAQVNYNKVIKGNEVEFIGPMEYDQPVEPTNESTADEEFKAKAREKLNINGIGLSAGLQFLF